EGVRAVRDPHRAVGQGRRADRPREDESAPAVLTSRATRAPEPAGSPAVAYRCSHGWADSRRRRDRAGRGGALARLPAAVLAYAHAVQRRRAQRGAPRTGAARARRDE